MYPYLFGIKYLNMYGLCIGIGVILCLNFLSYGCKKLKIPAKFENFVFYNAIISIACGILSGMLFQSFYDWIDALETNPDAKFEFGTMGITFLGGLIGGVVIFLSVYFLYGRKKYGAYLIRLLPIAACCILVAHGFGRLGCLCYGCCYGKTFEGAHAFAIHFPEQRLWDHDTGTWYTRSGIWAYPTQLYESMFLLATFGVCAFLTIKKKYKYTMNIYLIVYGIFRFFIEFIRGDDRGQIFKGFPLSPSQFWAIIMVIIGIALYFILPYIIKKFNIDFDAEEVTEEAESEETAQTA